MRLPRRTFPKYNFAVEELSGKYSDQAEKLLQACFSTMRRSFLLDALTSVQCITTSVLIFLLIDLPTRVLSGDTTFIHQFYIFLLAYSVQVIYCYLVVEHCIKTLPELTSIFCTLTFDHKFQIMVARCVQTDEVAGLATLRFQEEENKSRALVNRLRIASKYYGYEVETILVKHCEQLAKAQDCTQLFVYGVSKNFMVMKTCEQLGYRFHAKIKIWTLYPGIHMKGLLYSRKLNEEERKQTEKEKKNNKMKKKKKIASSTGSSLRDDSSDTNHASRNMLMDGPSEAKTEDDINDYGNESIGADLKDDKENESDGTKVAKEDDKEGDAKSDTNVNANDDFHVPVVDD